ncbi:hypothetical protein [Amycolatopsis sp. NPDC050768]|uniref:hypothetical protein n=1 Tax=Amycolatopsis sp. NPDC050768 TaxID=3154839 RepID=UPI00340946A2
MGTKKSKPWTSASAAKAAREARIATARYLREAPLAQEWETARLVEAFQAKLAHLRHPVGAAQLLLAGLGYDPRERPTGWDAVAEQVLVDEARFLEQSQLYVLSPQMCDVVIAAAQSLTLDDLGLLALEDLPSPTGLVLLPHPLMVRAVNGNLGDDRALHWRTPASFSRPNDDGTSWAPRPAVRVSSYHDSYGPVRPDSFLEFADESRRQGYPLPRLLLDSIQCHQFESAPNAEQRDSLEHYFAASRQVGQAYRSAQAARGADEDRVLGEYQPGTEIDNADGAFNIRFLYAFWRLCAQEIAVTAPADVRHAAQLAATKHGVSPDVRVVQLRTVKSSQEANSTDAGDGRWQHRWVVRMHKVRQWYPSEHRHKIIYRGPYLKGPDDKPLLGGEVVRSLTR